MKSVLFGEANGFGAKVAAGDPKPQVLNQG